MKFDGHKIVYLLPISTNRPNSHHITYLINSFHYHHRPFSVNNKLHENVANTNNEHLLQCWAFPIFSFLSEFLSGNMFFKLWGVRCWTLNLCIKAQTRTFFRIEQCAIMKIMKTWNNFCLLVESSYFAEKEQCNN